MKTRCLTIRNCPLPVRDALKERAKSNGHSLNAGAIGVLSTAVPEKPGKLSEGELLRLIRRAKTETSSSVKETRHAIDVGRPARYSRPGSARRVSAHRRYP